MTAPVSTRQSHECPAILRRSRGETCKEAKGTCRHDVGMSGVGSVRSSLDVAVVERAGRFGVDVDAEGSWFSAGLTSVKPGVA